MEMYARYTYCGPLHISAIYMYVQRVYRPHLVRYVKEEEEEEERRRDLLFIQHRGRRGSKDPLYPLPGLSKGGGNE